MKIAVEHIDTNGVTSNRTYNISLLAFIKHMAIAGQGYAPKPQKLMRTIGMLFHYNQYMKWDAFYNDRFSEPPIKLSDPTEKGQFSNIAGKAIADFLSKRIDRSLYTVNYEAEMRLRKLKIGKVSRPDLIAYTQNSVFALEAKGFSGNHGDMNAHKNQSMTGGIPVNFTVACVSYDLYNKIKCKYHDPYNDNVRFNPESLRSLTKKYYSGLAKFLDQKIFPYRESEINGEIFYELDLFQREYRNESILFPLHSRFWLYEIFDFYRPKLLLPQNIFEYAKDGIDSNVRPFIFESAQQNNIYVDNDRVGLKIR